MASIKTSTLHCNGSTSPSGLPFMVSELKTCYFILNPRWTLVWGKSGGVEEEMQPVRSILPSLSLYKSHCYCKPLKHGGRQTILHLNIMYNSAFTLCNLVTTV